MSRTTRSDRVSDEVAELAAQAERELPELIARVTAEIRRDMAFYRSDMLMTEELLHESVTAHLTAALHVLVTSEPPDLERARSTGEQRALQGAPLPEVLRAFRIGFGALWNLLSERAEAEGVETLRAMVCVASVIWTLSDDYSEAITTSYREASAHQMLRQQQQRSTLVEALLSGAMTDQGSLWEIAGMLQIPVNGRFMIVAAQSPALGRAALPDIEPALLAQRFASAWRLFPDLQVGIVSLGDNADESDRAAAIAVLRQKMTTRIGLSPSFRGLNGTPRGLRLAKTVLASIPDGSVSIASFDQSPLASLVASSPEESDQLLANVLGPLLELPAEERELLLSTLRTWLDNQGSTKTTADRMYCHPNTLRYRLRRVQDLLGRTLTDPLVLADLVTALRVLDIRPATG
ncbi:MAG: helix-turn-helix domain-containing protein [Geodermatophilaceae bacterium]|nr:helix-turn-helix domain-containing protein [Geodermatophilaceae bacterium]